MPTANPLQRYQVMEVLGAGGQGNTFRGIDRETSEEVAIKVISLRRLQEWKSFDLFEREIEVLASLSHPGVPRYIDNYASEESGDYFLVMELVDGTPLSKFVDPNNKLDPKKVRRVFEGALDILEYLHGQTPPVIHRDIKPANMILRHDGTLALVDFGGVRRHEGGMSTVVGTFGYMAPEQLHGQADPRSDIYALGATLAALLVGKGASDLPHDGLRVDLPALGLPDQWFSLLEAMLQPEPAERLATVADVRREAKSARRTPQPKPGTRPDAGPKKKTETEPSVALAKIPTGAKVLAQTPAPFSVLVWIATALGSGALLVFEAVIMPVIFQIWSATLGDANRAEEDERMKQDFDEFRGRVQSARNTLSYVAKHTRPSTE